MAIAGATYAYLLVCMCACAFADVFKEAVANFVGKGRAESEIYFLKI